MKAQPNACSCARWRLPMPSRFRQLFPHWEIVKFLMNRVPWPYPEDGALRFIRDTAIPQEERGEAWHWTLRLRTEPAQIIGVINLVEGRHKSRILARACLAGSGFDERGRRLGQRLLVRHPRLPRSPRVAKAIANTAPAASQKSKACAWSEWKIEIMSPAGFPQSDGRSPPRNGANGRIADRKPA